MSEPVRETPRYYNTLGELLTDHDARMGAYFVHIDDYIALERSNAALVQERDALQAQLPAGMKHCTILFRECEKGHGWLTATNWIQHDCLVCERDALQARLTAAERDAGRYRWLRYGGNFRSALRAVMHDSYSGGAVLHDEQLDTAIDAAMQGGSDG